MCYEDRATGYESGVISKIRGRDPSILLKCEIVHGRDITVKMMG